MSMNQDYILFTLQLALGIFSGIGLFYWDVTSGMSWILLVPISLLFGLTAASSLGGFHHSTWLSGSVMMFAPLGLVELFSSLFVFTTNLLISYFAGPKASLKSLYSTTSIPVLIGGLAVSTLAVGFVAIDEGAEQQFRDGLHEELSNQFGVLEDALDEQEAQDELQSQLVMVSEETVSQTSFYVSEQMTDELDPEQSVALQEAFEDAQDEIPDQVSQGMETSAPDEAFEAEDLADEYMDRYYRTEYLGLLIPVITIIVFSLQPIIGIGTALVAQGALRADRYIRREMS